VEINLTAIVLYYMLSKFWALCFNRK